MRVRKNALVKGVIHTIAGGPDAGYSKRRRKQYGRQVWSRGARELVLSVEQEDEITFGNKDVSVGVGSQNDPMVIKMDIASYAVHKVLVDNGSSADINFRDVLKKMDLDMMQLNQVHTPLVGFGGSEVISLGTIELPVSIGEEPRRQTRVNGIGEVSYDQKEARRCYNLSLKKGSPEEKKGKGEKKVRWSD
ncbi:UNVERIFIED_CONTAM: hypothetical protein Slati_3765500 [Sesamum latifolium]|uniref:Gag-pol polyprotein n=1 Tax=Sesamum latifolium TaxID=2727402 RepID=A0AAW2U4M3_9LAMI